MSTSFNDENKEVKMYLRFVGLGIQNLTFYKNRQSATVFVDT